MPNVGNLYGYIDNNSSPTKTFTTSTTLVAGMPLYDNTGTNLYRKVGNIIDSNTFEMLPTVVKFKSSGLTSWYLDSNGDLYGCGDNQYGQQGISSATTYVATFTKRASNVADFDCSIGATWYITTDNKLYGCGQNDKHQQGDGTTTNVESFTQRATGVSKVITNPYTTWYITTGGALVGCGNNNNGQQSTGNTTEVTTFTQRVASGVVDVKAGGGGVTWYLTSDGKLYGCGGNVQGNQGDGTGGTTPNYVANFTQRASNVAQFDCTSQETWYVTTDGKLYGCGRNNCGQQGIASSTARVLYFTQRATGVRKVACDSAVTWYITTDNKLYGCGSGTYGQQGGGTTNNVEAFTLRSSNAQDIFPSTRSTWYINTNGTLYGCGINTDGNQGVSDTSTNITTFTQRATNVSDCVALTTTIVITYYYVTWYISHGELYGCGNNQYGQQGDGSTSNVTSFTHRAG